MFGKKNKEVEIQTNVPVYPVIKYKTVTVKERSVVMTITLNMLVTSFVAYGNGYDNSFPVTNPIKHEFSFLYDGDDRRPLLDLPQIDVIMHDYFTAPEAGGYWKISVIENKVLQVGTSGYTSGYSSSSSASTEFLPKTLLVRKKDVFSIVFDDKIVTRSWKEEIKDDSAEISSN